MNSDSRFLSNSVSNMVGTFFYFLCQWITTLLVLYLAGFKDVGIYSVAISFSNIFGFISRYGVRQYQVSDIGNQYSDADYLVVRAITSLAAVGLFIIGLLFYRFGPESLLCCVILLFFKLLESATDVLFGIFQKMNAYRSIAISYILKGLFPVLVFGGLLFIQKSLVVACVGMTIGYGLVLLFYDLPILRKREGFPGPYTSKTIKQILKCCFPLMLFTLLNPYMTFITRYAIENRYSSEILGYYSSLSMVVVVLSTLAGSIWAVVSPWAAAKYNEKRYGEIARFSFKVLLALAALAVLMLLCGYFFGDFALGLVFGKEIVPYSYLLNPLLFVSVLLTLVAYENTLLISFRQQKGMLILNAVGTLACIGSVNLLVNKFGMLGSCLSLMLGIGLQAILVGGYIVWGFKRNFSLSHKKT